MKKKKINLDKKLSFHKETITILAESQQHCVLGGEINGDLPEAELRTAKGKPCGTGRTCFNCGK